LDHFFKNNNDSDCIYIFDNLPQDLQKKLDELAGEISKQNVVLLKNLDELLEASSKRNKKLDDDIYQIENELERVRELNRQLGI
jgi:beta-glucosidase-like glycosyl hydrolase